MGHKASKMGISFRGENEVNLDDKGRLAVPARYRQSLMDYCTQQLVLAPSPQEACLLLYPLPAWLEIEKELNSMPNLNDGFARRIQRMFIGKAKDVVMDKSGRILVAPDFRKKYRLEKNVFLVGVGKKFEIWRHDLWLEQESEWENDISAASEAVQNLSI